MANEPKVFVCKYCGAERIITDQYRSTCKRCKSRKALVRRPEDSVPMYNTRLMNEGERMKADE